MRFLLTPSLLALSFLAVRMHPAIAGTPAGRVAKTRANSSVGIRVDRTLAGYLTPQELSGAVYVGSEYCMGCHTDMARWRTSLHAQTLIRPMTKWSLVVGKGVLADFDGNGVDDFQQGLDLNTVSSAFDAYKPNAPRFSMKNGVYTISIGALDLPVVYVQQWREEDGEWLQLFAVRVPLSDSPSGFSEGIYSAPVDYRTSGRTWEAYAPEVWYGADNKPLYAMPPTTAQITATAESHSQNCIGCHATGTRSIAQNARGEWVFRAYPATLLVQDDPGYIDLSGDGTPQLSNVGCESCHGPGSLHVATPTDLTRIVNPAKLTEQGGNEVCGQCHSVIASAPTGAIGWPYNETTSKTWIPGGDPLSGYTTDAEVWWPDGKTGIDTSQFPEIYKSHKENNGFHNVRCTECHDPHGPTTNNRQIVQLSWQGDLEIPVRVEDNTLCLACHATHGSFQDITKESVADYDHNALQIGVTVSAHSHHPYGPERSMGLSRCTNCHMATTQGPGELTLHGHTFEAIPPTKTLAYQDQGGMPNSCALSCHGGKVNSFGLGLDPNPDPTVWNDPFDKALAAALSAYYGPSGTWWTTPTAPVTPAASHRTVTPSSGARHSKSKHRH